MDTETYTRRLQWHDVLLRIAFLGLLTYLYFFRFSGAPDPFFSRHVVIDPTGGVKTWKAMFRLPTPEPFLTIDIRWRKVETAQLTLNLTDPAGRAVLKNLRITGTTLRFACGEALAPGTYTLRAGTANTAGEYDIGVAAGLPWTIWQKSLLLLIGLSFLLGGMDLYQHWRQHTVRGPSALHQQITLAFAAVFSILCYLLVHEGGHAIASMAFGTFDWSAGNTFGLNAPPQPRHTGAGQLKDWQLTVQSAAGPLTPTLLGYLLAALWLAPWGRRLRTRHPDTDALWTFTAATALFAHVGLLLPMMRITRDVDYLYVIRYGPLTPWAVDAILLGMAVVSAALLFPLARHLWRLLPDLSA